MIDDDNLAVIQGLEGLTWDFLQKRNGDYQVHSKMGFNHVDCSRVMSVSKGKEISCKGVRATLPNSSQHVGHFPSAF